MKKGKFMIYIKKIPFFVFYTLSHTNDALVAAASKFQIGRV